MQYIEVIIDLTKEEYFKSYVICEINIEYMRLCQDSINDCESQLPISKVRLKHRRYIGTNDQYSIRMCSTHCVHIMYPLCTHLILILSHTHTYTHTHTLLR